VRVSSNNNINITYHRRTKHYTILWRHINAFGEYPRLLTSCACGSCCFSAGRGPSHQTRTTVKEEETCTDNTHRRMTICPTVGYPVASSVWKTCAKTLAAPVQLRNRLTRKRGKSVYLLYIYQYSVVSFQLTKRACR